VCACAAFGTAARNGATTAALEKEQKERDLGGMSLDDAQFDESRQ
jgi:hypothetical protein